MKKKQISVVLAALMFSLSLFGCKKTEETTVAPPETATTAAPTTELPVMTLAEVPKTEEVLPEGMMRSYLTGEIVPVEIGTRRPIGFQIDNEKRAQPQNGVSSAEIVYEVPIEAYEVRLTAIFQDMTDIDRIGPLRSARSYHPGILAEYDGIFFHHGHSDIALPYLNDERCDDLEGIENSGWPAVFESSDHSSGHNTFTNPEKTDSRIADLGFRTTMKEDYEYKFLFNKSEVPLTPEGGIACQEVHFNYKQNDSWFDYNKDEGKYYRYAYGEKHIDQENDTWVSVENIIVEYCSYNLEWDKDTKNIHTVGTGSGWFITNGTAVPINWSKADYWDNTHYYYENGEEITLNQGKTWVAIVLPELTGEITIK